MGEKVPFPLFPPGLLKTPLKVWKAGIKAPKNTAGITASPPVYNNPKIKKLYS